MFKSLSTLLRDDSGATMVEYGILVALIAAVSILIITNVGTKVLGAFTKVDNAMP